MQWETVIGLEIHAQLATQSKIFSGSSTAFGAAPNTQASLVDLAMPGTLPVLNEEAVRMACLFGLAIDARIDRQNVFARKNYFYPDLPKGYQTSQMDHPIVGKGHLDITLEDGTTKRIGITRAHLEEDAGKSLHEDFQGMSGIDLNRAGTPLLEIVSEPDIRSAKEAVAYVKAIHALVRYLGICDGNMAEGSLRCDCNVSVRPKGQAEFGTRAEIKNVNSFRFIEKAINHEIQRQIELIEDGGKVVQETRLYDPNKDETRSMRGKEEANDYRYFPCPDLLPVVIEPEYLAKLREQLPELPVQKRERFESQYGLSTYDASVLSASREMADYFEKVQGICGDAKLAANWVMVELGSLLNKDGLEIEQSPVSAEQLGGMILRIKDNTISGKIAKMVFEAMANGEGSADQIIEAKGLKQVTDSGAIEKMLDEVLAANAEQVEQYRAADEAKRGKMFGFFVGQAMKASKGKANPQQVNELLKKSSKRESKPDAGFARRLLVRQEPVVHAHPIRRRAPRPRRPAPVPRRLLQPRRQRFRGYRRSLLLWQPPRRPAYRQRRALQPQRNDRCPPHVAVRYPRAGNQPRQPPQRGGADQRSRAVPPRTDHRCIAQGRRRPGYDPQRRGAGSDRVAGLSHLLPTTGTFR